MNALRHGLLSKCVVLPNESQGVFDALMGQYLSKLQPADEIEYGAVEKMVAAEWREFRLMAVETRLLKNAVSRRPETDELDRIAGAFSDLAKGPELLLIHRYEGRINRLYQRALQNLFLFSDSEPEPQMQIDETNPGSNNPSSINLLEPQS